MTNNIDTLLVKLNACDEAIEWAKGKTWQEIYNTCDRGDWLLWLFKKTNPIDLQRLTLAKVHCVNTIIHLIKDERGKAAVKAAIAFGNGEISRKELDDAAADAAAAYAAAAYAAADAAAYAAAAAAAAYAAAADAAAAYAAEAAAYAAADAAAAYAAARMENQKETADICRKYLPIEIWNIK